MNRNTTAVILIVLAIGIYFTFTRAKLAEVNEVRAVNEHYITALASAKELLDVRDSVLRDYNAVEQEDRERLEKMLPNTVDNIRLIIDLNGVALRHGFTLKNIKATVSPTAAKQLPAAPTQTQNGLANTPNSIIPTPTLDSVTVSFGVTAPYQRFIDLLRDLEANLRIMDVTHLTVAAAAPVAPGTTNPTSATKATSATGGYDFTVELKTYYLRQQ